MTRLAALFSLLLALAPAARAQLHAEDLIGRETAISVRDAIVLALENNLDLSVARTDQWRAEQAVYEAQGAYDPLVFGGYERGRRDTPIASPVQVAFGGGLLTVDETVSHEAGLRGLLPFGVNWSSTYTLDSLKTSSAFNALFPEHRANWTSAITIPVLKDLLYNQTDVRVKSSKLSFEIADEDFRRELLTRVKRVEELYWGLTGARERSRVARKSLQTARDLLEQVQVQYEVGVVSKVRIAEAEAGVAAREFDEIRERNAVGNAQDLLLREILAPDPTAFESTSVITANPTFVEYSVDGAVALQKARDNRPELESARRRMEDAELQYALAANQLLPSVDFVASYTRSGISGDEKNKFIDVDIDPDPDVSNTVTVPNDLRLTDGRSAADDSFLHSGPDGWTLGVEVEMPLTNTTARAVHVQRKIDLRRATTEFRRTEQTVTLEVRSAVRALRNSTDAVKAAERRRVAQEETLRAEQERLRLGDSTPYQVLELEEDLAEAERDEVDAIQVYRVAIAELERAQATLLQSRGISVEAELRRDPLD